MNPEQHTTIPERRSPADLPFRKRVRTWFIANLGTLIIRLLNLTWRWRTLNEDVFHQHMKEGGVIVPFWHNRIVGGCPAAIWKLYDSLIVVSRHSDGEIISRIQQNFEHRAIRGSSSRGGPEALDEMEAEVRKGTAVGITPDGPRGPKYVAKRGVAAVAVRTQRPVIPFIVAARSRWKFRSWDNFEVPKPFTECTLLFGNPILSDGDTESTRARIETEMRRMVVEAEALYDRGPDFPINEESGR